MRLLLRRCLGLARRYSTAEGRHVDIVVAGGGMVGAAFANACGVFLEILALPTEASQKAQSEFLSGKEVLLLEAAPKTVASSTDDAAFSNRVSALSPGTQHFFHHLGIWTKLKRPSPVDELTVYESCSDARIRFGEHSLDPVAHIVENNDIVKCLMANLEGTDVDVLLPSTSTCDFPVEIRLKDGSLVTTDLLVGADGARSAVRQALGCNYVSWEYGQRAIVATIKVAEDESRNRIAWQRFTPTGPVALLPLNKDTSSLVWTTTDVKAKELLAHSDDQFVDALNEILWEESNQNDVVNSTLQVWNRVTGCLAPGGKSLERVPPNIMSVVEKSRAAFPLGFGHSVRYVDHRVALIGDAAHRCHPLAGQGVNLGFRDVQELVSALETAVRCGADIGDISHLYKYERRRQVKNLPVMLVIDWLNRLYCTTMLPFVLPRSLGLSAVNTLVPLKKFLMSEAAR